MDKKLPEKSESRGIQPRHIRRYKSGRVTVVNRDVLKRFRNIRPKVRKSKREDPKPEVHPSVKVSPRKFDTEVGKEFKVKFNQFDAPNDALGNAIMFYFIDFENKYGDLTEKDIAELGQDASNITMLAPIWYHIDSYKPNEFKRMWPEIAKDMKHIDVDSKNKFSIMGSAYHHTPISIAALLIWAVYRLSGRQLKNQPGYSWINTAELLMKK